MNRRAISPNPSLVVQDVLGKTLRLARDHKPFDVPSWLVQSYGNGYVVVTTRNARHSPERSSIEWPILRRMIERGYLVVE